MLGLGRVAYFVAGTCVIGPVTSVLGGCAFPYPAVWSKCPDSQHLVVEGEFRCGGPNLPPTPSQVAILKQRPIVDP